MSHSPTVRPPATRYNPPHLVCSRRLFLPRHAVKFRRGKKITISKGKTGARIESSAFPSEGRNPPAWAAGCASHRRATCQQASQSLSTARRDQICLPRATKRRAIRDDPASTRCDRVGSISTQCEQRSSEDLESRAWNRGGLVAARYHTHLKVQNPRKTSHMYIDAEPRAALTRVRSIYQRDVTRSQRSTNGEGAAVKQKTSLLPPSSVQRQISLAVALYSSTGISGLFSAERG
ncbi:hypothetical protein HPB51_020035 [Rhipicephalus microplus]|uniref:Uncharacterized protein n=1 Tax=Rhipicephalus microplus TaxID=6941 RepID=A0A9J6DC50_RHIMP|nr:hypothetical protein HPB51_020035 [Rhipicephalus microplus]